MKAAAVWRADHDGALPSSAADRAAFKDLIGSWQRTIDGCPIPEENFAEAVAAAHKVWAPPVLSESQFTIISLNFYLLVV